MIIHFPQQASRIYAWAKAYAILHVKEGYLAAGKYAADNIPTQFQTQITPLVEREILKLRNDNVTD